MESGRPLKNYCISIVRINIEQGSTLAQTDDKNIKMGKRERLLIRSKNAAAYTAFLWELVLVVVIVLMQPSMDCTQMATLSIVQELFNIGFLNAFAAVPLISIPTVFSLFSLIFHAGQLIKMGYGIPGEVPLPFQLYGESVHLQKAFLFYLLSQMLLTVGIYLVEKKGRQKNESTKKLLPENVLWCGEVLMVIGALPRIFIDFRALAASRSGGYEGVYLLYTPQALQTLAFFFDAGLLFLLFGCNDKRKRSLLFLAVLLYKGLMMSTGSRQEKIGFLLVWLYLYYFVLQKINYKKLAGLIVLCVVGLMFVMAIGSVRSSSGAGVAGIVHAMFSSRATYMLGNILGEFGAAIDTIIIAVKYAPDTINYGLGTTYIAGLLSVIPGLISKFPVLAESTSFLGKLPQDVVYALGGSYLGEFYYNFAWLGSVLCIPLGALLAATQDCITSEKTGTSEKCWYAALTTLLLLFVRGYFTDMIQKLVWLVLAVIFLRLWETERINATYRMRERSRRAE